VFTINVNLWGFLAVIIAGAVIITSIILIIKNYKSVEFNKRNGIFKFKKNMGSCEQPCEINKFSSIIMLAFNYGKRLENFDNETLKEQLTFSDNVLDNIIQKMSDIFLDCISKSTKKAKEELNQSYDFYYFTNFIELVINKIKYMIKTDLREDYLWEKNERQFNNYKKEKCDNIKSKFNLSKYNILYQSNLGLTSELLEEIKINFYDLVEVELIKILDNAKTISIERLKDKDKLLKEVDEFYLRYTGKSSEYFINDLL
jgi:hypothetical protein